MNKVLAFLGVILVAVFFMDFGMFVVERLDLFARPEARGMLIGLLTGLLIGKLTDSIK